MIIGSNEKLLMIGDSITDVGRSRPIGEGFFGGLGDGYVSLVSAIINTVFPERKIHVLNMGISGNTVRDLAARWQTDVYDQNPDWLSIMIGINDVWRQFDSPFRPEWAVFPDEYRKTLETLIKDTLPKVKGIILMSPYMLDKNDVMRAQMNIYGKACMEIAAKYNVIFVDIQAAFDKAMEVNNSYIFSEDRIHPNIAGHMIIAHEFLKALGMTALKP